MVWKHPEQLRQNLMFFKEPFEGPHDMEAHGVPRGRHGVYIIVARGKDGLFRMVDCDHSEAIDTALEDRKNRATWGAAYGGPLYLYVWLPDQDDPERRAELAEAIRNRYYPWCRRPKHMIGEAGSKPSRYA